MKATSLREISKELWVSHSYLSQVKSGKRPTSHKVVSNGLLKSDYLPYNEPKCQRSSGVEQRFRKPLVVGSNPTAGSTF